MAGTAARTRCVCSRRRACGSCSFPTCPTARVQVRDPDAGRRAPEEDAIRSGWRSKCRRRRRRSSATSPGISGTTTSGCGAARAAAAGSSGRCRSTKCISARGRGCPKRATVPRPTARLADRLRAVRQGPGLHAHRAAAGDGASVFRIVGLSGDRIFCADQPLRSAGRFQVVRRRLPSAPAWA